jgi:hypothetical protein
LTAAALAFFASSVISGCVGEKWLLDQEQTVQGPGRVRMRSRKSESRPPQVSIGTVLKEQSDVEKQEET